MSAKWRALQHRHRYTYSAVVFPTSLTDSLNQILPQNSSYSKFYTELKELTSLNSIYSQVNHAKKVASAFSELMSAPSNDESLLSEAARFYLEVMFLENSLQLHRTMVSALAKTKNYHSLIRSCFSELCTEYGGFSNKKKRFCVSRVALSVMGMPKLGYLVDVIADCAVMVAWDVVFGLNGVVLETEELARPSPIVMEQCQEGLSCLYYLLQRFPEKFRSFYAIGNDSEGESSNVMAVVFRVLLKILKSLAFSRDCYVAAGVSFFAALQVCLNSQDLGLVIIEGIFYQKSCCFGNNNGCENKFNHAIRKIPYDRDFCSEISGLSLLSRVCLIRGILTAVSREVLNTPFVVSLDNGSTGSTLVKTILYNGILPELCDYCENPSDSHFNFHALTVMQICLQQIKTSLLANLTDTSENYNAIPEETGTRILRIIWNNLEDPLSQTVKQVHLIFDLFLDIESTLRQDKGSERIKSFLRKIASDLLRLGPRCKGRYVPLASLTKRLGAKTILDMSPDLILETVHAYVDDDVCCAASSYLKCFLEYFRDECWSSDGIESGYAVYRSHCLPPFLFGLASGVSKLRSNLNTYALPVLLDMDVDSIFPMLAFISVGPNEDENGISYPELGCTNTQLTVEQNVSILVSLLKVSRSLALLDGDIDTYENSECNDLYAVVCIKGIKVKITVGWLALALTHTDESLRVDAAESLFLSPKTASLPSNLELTLLKEAVPLNMRCCSTAFQMKWCSLFRKFFSRVRTALERQYKQGSWQPLICNGTVDKATNRAENLFNFMRWLSSFLFFSCYPSAPYKRKIMAMELIQIMMNVWAITPSHGNFLYPYSKGVTSPDSTLLLVGSIIDSWDRLRESSFRILLHFPTPLPGISSEERVCQVTTWAKKLVCSPRVRESDAGALTLRLIFRKYVIDLGWIVGASVDVVCHSSYPENVYPVIEYIKSLIDWLEFVAKEGERDLSKACRNSFVHGVLLTLRYTFEELDWNSEAMLSGYSEMRSALEKLLELVMRITSLALWVVSADAWYLPEDMDEMLNDDDFLMDGPDEVDDQAANSVKSEDKDSKLMQDVRPSDQIVMVGCWLAMKEVSLLLGTIIRKIPLPSSSSVDSSDSGAANGSTARISDPMLDLEQLEKIGSHFLEVLLKMKHNGAIDKTRAGFTALCNRLLCSNDPRLCRLTESWMEQLMDRTVAKGQLVDNLLRRSAGIPAAFIALFLAEPEGAPKRLLPRALRWLIDVAKKPLLGPIETKGTKTDSWDFLLNKSNQDPESTLKSSKIRDEGVVPTVHAFNVLRAAFNDTNLATDTSGFSAEALIVAVRSFSSPYWEVRNSACLAYTALVKRMIGFLNVQKRESARRALTGLEFFHRYPSLHPFMFNELKVITELLQDVSSGQSESNLANVVHPSLCPMLILLSRLKPSPLASESGDDLDPFLFMPFISRCSIQSNLRVRVLASRALTGLVSNEKLPAVILDIGSELPSSVTHRASFNLIHGILLQLGTLLDVNCRNIVDFAKKDQILVDLIKILKSCSWIASPKRCHCPILNTSFLKVLDHMLNIARTCQISKSFNSVHDLLLDLSTECLDVNASHRLSFYDPTIAELLEQAAKSYFSCVYQASNEAGEVVLCFSPDSKSLNVPETKNGFDGLLDRLVRSLSNSTYEVRLATLKWLLKFLRSVELGTKVCGIYNWMKTNLQEELMSRLKLEDHHRCIYRILRILFTWNSVHFRKTRDEISSETIWVGGMDCDSVSQFWETLISLYERERHSKTREMLIKCMATCIKRFSGMITDSVLADLEKSKRIKSGECDHYGRLYGCITFFVNVIKQHSSSSEPVNIRKAAADSLIASGLLEQAEVIGSHVFNCRASTDFVNMYARKVLEMWFECTKLLEDEDDVIRQRLSMDVQKCFCSKRYGSSSHGAAGVPTQVEKVIETVFEYLSSIFGTWIEYFDYLLQLIQNAASNVVSKGDLVRRVFDKEIDNHHEEKLLISQICCSQLEKIPISKSWATDLSNKDWIRNYLLNWRTRFCSQLMSFVKVQSERPGEVDWIGGIGNHKDAFLPVYANLLGFYALSKCIFNDQAGDHMPLLSDVVELSKNICPYLRNPLVCNLYFTVGKLHEEKIGAAVDLTGGDEIDLIWEGFHPYFLIW